MADYPNKGAMISGPRFNHHPFDQLKLIPGVYCGALVWSYCCPKDLWPGIIKMIPGMQAMQSR